MANIVKHKRGSGNDPSASDLVLGELAIRTDNGKLFTKMDSGAIAEIAGGGSDIAINTLSSSSATGGGSATFNGSAYRFTLSSPPSVSAQQLLVSIAGVIQKPVAGSGQPSEGFSINGNDIILAQAPATGTDFFILTFRSLGVSEPADNTVTNAKVASNAAIAGTKIDPDFGSQSVNVEDGYAYGFGDNTYRIEGKDDGANARISFITANSERMRINSGGQLGIGTANPNRLLHQHENSAGVNYHLFTNSNTGAGGSDGLLVGITGAGQGIMWNYENQKLRFAPNATERLTIAADGKVGIGATSPSRLLHQHENSSDANYHLFTNTGTGNSSSNGGIVGIDSSENLILWNQENTNLRLATNNSERMRIDSSGNVGIGTTSPTNKLDVTGSIGVTVGLKVASHPVVGYASTLSSYATRLGSTGTTTLRYTQIYGGGNIIATCDGTNGNVGIGTTSPSAKLQVSGGHINIDSGYSYQWGNSHERIEQSDGKIEFFTNNGEQMTLDGSNLGLGNTSPAAHLHLDGGTSGAQQLRVHNHSSIGTFSGNYGSEFRHATSATAHAMLIHAHEANDARRTLDISDFNGIFATFVNGKVGIGTTSPNRTLHQHVNNSGANYHQFTNSACGTGDGDGSFVGIDSGEDLIVWNQEVNAVRLATSNTERMRITSDGKVRIGDSLGTNAAGKFQVIEESGVDQANDTNAYFETNAVDWNIKTYYNTSGTHYHISFVEQGTMRGFIAGNDGSNVTYTSGSDYRWKENIVDLSGSEGIEICKKLKPRKYNWIENREVTGEINTVDGFIAHEVEEAGVTGAVSGEKDAIYEDGSIKGQTLDYGQMTPVLAAAIKGLISKVEVLETKVTALGG